MNVSRLQRVNEKIKKVTNLANLDALYLTKKVIKTGDVFFVNNTIAKINLKNSKITNKDKDGIFLRAEAAGWGNSASIV